MSAENKPEIILEISNLTKRFPGIVANDAISLELYKGEIHALLGENGAGKSTLAECLFGYYQADSGEIRLHDQAIHISSPSDAIDYRIGMVHQHFQLIDTFSSVENIVLGTKSLNVIFNLDEARQRIKALCDQYELNFDINAEIWKLCVGEQQWVEILKALYVGVDLLILDEPTAVLTPQETDKLFSVLKSMKESGLSIIFITHKLREVMAVADRISILRKGKKVATITTSETNPKELARMMVGREVLFRAIKDASFTGEEVLTVDNIWTRNDRGVDALKGVSFSLYRGQILGLAGVTGNGQKELFEVLTGVRKATQGEVILSGENVINFDPYQLMLKGIGYIPEDRLRSGIIPDFKVSENLYLGRQRLRPFRKGLFIDESAIQHYSKELVSQFDIATPSVNHLAKALSGGNQQKVILAREFTQQPKILLAAQPTRGLDVGIVEYIHSQLLMKRKEGMAILLASEELEELFLLSDLIAVIFQGEIQAILDPADTTLEKIGLLMAGVR